MDMESGEREYKPEEKEYKSEEKKMHEEKEDNFLEKDDVHKEKENTLVGKKYLFEEKEGMAEEKENIPIVQKDMNYVNNFMENLRQILNGENIMNKFYLLILFLLCSFALGGIIDKTMNMFHLDPFVLLLLYLSSTFGYLLMKKRIFHNM